MSGVRMEPGVKPPPDQRAYWLALRLLQRRGIKPEEAADWPDERLLSVPGFGKAKLEGWREVFPRSERQEVGL